MVLPVHDINPLARRPYVTWLLIAVNVVVFVFFEPVTKTVTGTNATTASTLCSQQGFFDTYAAIPRELLDNRQLARPVPAAPGELRGDGVACADRVPQPHKTPFLSVLFSMFLHGGWAHLLGNMAFLLIFGNNIEDRMGRLRFLFFYLVCGYAAAYGFSLIDRGTTTLVGASGAIAGVLGAYLVTFPKARVVSLLTFFFFLPVRLPAWLVLGSWFVLQYFYFSGFGLAQGSDVAYGAHVVGFVVGALVTLPFVHRLRAGRVSGSRPATA